MNLTSFVGPRISPCGCHLAGPLPLKAVLTRSVPLTSASRLAHLCRSIPIGSIDSFAPALSAVRPARLSRSIPIDSIHAQNGCFE